MSGSRTPNFWRRHFARAAVAAALLLTGAAAGAQPAALIQNVQARKTTSLDGLWRIIIDPYENGYYDYRYEPSPNGYFRNVKPQSEGDLIEYDFDTSDTLR